MIEGRCMQVPNAAEAFVPPAKLHAYLLAEDHGEGGPKARLLRSFGYDESNAALLEAQLLEIVRSNPVERAGPAPFGMKYVVHGILQAPIGRELAIRTVWIVPPGDPHPRLVTAYPIRD
jgi:hypothetical protein